MLERDALTAAQELAREEHLAKQEAARAEKLDPLIDRVTSIRDWLVTGAGDPDSGDDMDRAIEILIDCVKGDEEELPQLLSLLDSLEQRRRLWKPKKRFAVRIPRPPRESETPDTAAEPSVIAELREEPLVPVSDEVEAYARAEDLAPRAGPGQAPSWAWRSQKSRNEGWIDWDNLEW
jgi:hypothetical protein